MARNKPKTNSKTTTGRREPASADVADADELRARVEALTRDRRALLELVSEAEENRRRIEQARREWTQALDAIDRPLFVHDQQYHLTRVNRAYAEQAGAGYRELIGRPYYECFPRLAGPLPGCRAAGEAQRPQQERLVLDDGRVFVSRSYPIAAADDDHLQALHVLEDVTDQERAESQARTLGRAVEQAAEGMVVLNADLSIAFINPAMAALTGHAGQDLVGRSITELRAQQLGPSSESIRRQVIADGQWRGEVQLLAADGTRIPANLSTAALFDEDGELSGFVASYLDLRPIKEASQQVETLFAAIQDVSLQLDIDTVAKKVLAAVTRVCSADGAAVAVVDPDSGRLFYRWYHGLPADASVEELSREFDPGDGLAGRVLQQGATQIIDDYPAFAHSLHSFVDAGVQSVMAVPFGATGASAGGILSVATLSRAHGFTPAQTRFAEALARQLGVAIHREQLVADVRASNARLARVFETVPDILFVVDAHDLGLELVSPAVTELLGYAPEELLARPSLWERIVHEGDRERVFREVRRAIRSGEGLTLDLRMWHKDGHTLRWFEGRGVVDRDADGRARVVTGALTDITVRRTSEQQLRRVNRALTTLSRGNEALVRADDVDALLRHVCENVTEAGGYALAWVGFAEDDESRSVRPVAWAGPAASYLDGVRVSWADNEFGSGPIGTAIRTNEPVMARDLSRDSRMEPWRSRALEHGLCSVIAIPLTYDDQVIGSLNIYSADVDAFDAAELRLLTELANDLSYGIKSLRARTEREHVERLYRDSLVDTIQAIARTVEKRDPYTAGHQQRVAELASAIGREMGLAPERIEGLRLGALIHDIGKIYIPAEILNRPGRLSSAEFEIIKTHPEVGYDIVKDVTFPWPVAEMILQHHERLDGSGYPRGLKGEEIVPEARIMAVADVVEAITSHRPYRPGHGIDRALEEIRTRRGTVYDPDVVDACLQLFEDKGLTLDALDATQREGPQGG